MDYSQDLSQRKRVALVRPGESRSEVQISLSLDAELASDTAGRFVSLMFELDTPTGRLQLPVLGVISDLSNQLGTVFIDRKTFVRHYQDDSVTVLLGWRQHL